MAFYAGVFVCFCAAVVCSIVVIAMCLVADTADELSDQAFGERFGDATFDSEGESYTDVDPYERRYER